MRKKRHPLESFVALDVETANATRSSICALGLAKFECGVEVESIKQLIDPRAPFRSINTSIHGITERMVRGAPQFSDICIDLASQIAGQVVACYSDFDRSALQAAFELAGYRPPDCDWVDTMQVAREAWPGLAAENYKLSTLAKHFGLNFKHHDPLEDARTCGRLLLLATTPSSDIDAYWKTIRADAISTGSAKTSGPWPEQVKKRVGAQQGPLRGEVIAITGTLSQPRSEIADRLAAAGADVCPSVNKRTTMLLVGQDELDPSSGKDLSAKYVKAMMLIAGGQSLRIVGESELDAILG